jgi:hypothetical protein
MLSMLSYMDYNRIDNTTFVSAFSIEALENS